MFSFAAIARFWLTYYSCFLAVVMVAFDVAALNFTHTHTCALTHSHTHTLSAMHTHTHARTYRFESETQTQTLTWFLLSTFSVVRAKLFSSSLSSPNWIEVFRFCLLEVVAQQSLLGDSAVSCFFCCCFCCCHWRLEVNFYERALVLHWCVCVCVCPCICLVLFIEIRLTYFVAGSSCCWCGYTGNGKTGNRRLKHINTLKLSSFMFFYLTAYLKYNTHT